jgi:ribonuclease P protein component
MRLRPRRRLLTAEDYRQVFKETALRARQPELMALARPNGTAQNRLGLAIAKKHVPLAVNRNLIKRLAREHFRRLKDAQPALDIVILTRPAARDSSRHRLNLALKQLFARLGLENSDP